MSDVDDTTSSTWTRPRFVIAALVVALIAIMAVVLALTTGRDDATAAQPTPSTEPSSTATPSPTATDGSICGLADGDQTIPVTAPVGIEWELVGTVAAPTSPEAGPGLVSDDGLRSCFARSPQGALHAALNMLATTSNPALRKAAASELTAAGAGRDALAAIVNSEPVGGTGTGLQIGGYSFLDYTPSSATVDVLIRLDGKVGHLVVPLSWERGDWKIVIPPDGDLYKGIQQLTSETGYVPWAGA